MRLMEFDKKKLLKKENQAKYMNRERKWHLEWDLNKNRFHLAPYLKDKNYLNCSGRVTKKVWK